MLTATDVHYLVGLLTRVSEGTDVEIELGDLVFDSAADKHRDVDVTVTRRDVAGGITAFKGIEVKNETRALDVVHVEQLCIKFADMSEVTDKAIVSASGYTDAATNKARAHGVELYEIVDWNDPSQGFTIRFPEAGFIFTEQYYQWVDYSVQLSVGAEYSQVLDEELKTTPVVCDSTGAPLPEVADYQALGASIAENALNAYLEKPESQKAEKNGPQIEAAIRLTPADRVFIKSSQGLIPIESALVTGRFRLVAIDHRPAFKVLRRFGEERPIIGCVVAAFANGNLMGTSVSNESGVCFLNIPARDRVLNKIRERRLS